MPFGFFGSAGVLLGLPFLLPLVYAFTWPGGISRPIVFLILAMVLGLIVGAAVFYWVISPLQGIGIAGGQGAMGASGANAIDSMLRGRFFVAIVGGLVLEAVFCRLLQALLLTVATP